MGSRSDVDDVSSPKLITDAELVNGEIPELTVLVTGFGPFFKNSINASWSIASTLPQIIPATTAHPFKIRLIIHPSPVHVAYQNVLSLIPKLLSSTDPSPDIVFHIGLASGRTFFTAENGAHRDGYHQIADVDGKKFSYADGQREFKHCPTVLKSGFDTEDVWRRWRQNVSDFSIDLRPSEDAGNFLCGFIYYNSLSWYYKQDKEGERPVMFLHVPDLPTEDDVAKGRQVAVGLIRACVGSKLTGRSKGKLLVGRRPEDVPETAPITDANFLPKA